MHYSIYTEPPKDYNPTVEVAGCYCEWKGKILLLKRHPNSPEGNTWGVPAGKMEKGETPKMGVIREVHEEIGLDIDDTELKEVGKLFVRLSHIDFIFHMFQKHFITEPNLQLCLDEHLEFIWVTRKEAMKLPLITGGREALDHYFTVSAG